jgi:hypothetical protein
MYGKEEFIDYLNTIGFKILQRNQESRYFIIIAEKVAK